jgi:transcriptional regulator with PAS, ATPase and Fis domain
MLYRMLGMMQRDIANLHNQIDQLQKGQNGVSAIPAIPHDEAEVEETEAEEYREEEEEARATEAHDNGNTEPKKNEKADEHTLLEQQKELIRQTLERNQGSRKRAAKELGISERTLYRKIEKYGL